MGYIKAIISGDVLELYNYEKNIGFVGGRREGVSRSVDMSNLVDGGSFEQKERILQRQVNKNRAVKAFQRLVLCNLKRFGVPLFITFTYAENRREIESTRKDWQSFIQSARCAFGSSFRYIAVPEYQRRGSIHFHSLFWGLPSNIGTEERRTRLVARLWGQGFVDIVVTDGDEALSGYMAKYMSKSYMDHRLYGKQCYRCSRNVVRPKVEKGMDSLFYLKERYSIEVDNFPCIDRQYDTMWLGKGRYRYYKNIIDKYYDL